MNILFDRIKFNIINKKERFMIKISNKFAYKVFKSNSKKIDCNVSIASNEIMLNRIFNGSRFEFPFSNYLN